MFLRIPLCGLLLSLVASTAAAQDCHAALRDAGSGDYLTKVYHVDDLGINDDQIGDLDEAKASIDKLLSDVGCEPDEGFFDFDEEPACTSGEPSGYCVVQTKSGIYQTVRFFWVDYIQVTWSRWD